MQRVHCDKIRQSGETNSDPCSLRHSVTLFQCKTEATKLDEHSAEVSPDIFKSLIFKNSS